MRTVLQALLDQTERDPNRIRVGGAGDDPAAHDDSTAAAWINRMLVDAIAGLVGELIDGGTDPGRPVLVSTGSGGAFWVGVLAAMLAERDAVPIAARAPRGVRDRIDAALCPACEIDAERVLRSARSDGAAWLAARLADPTWQSGGVILLSSGTTGRSRFVRRAAGAVERIGAGLVAEGLYREADLVGSFLPMHHAYGFEHAFLAPLLAGAAVRQGRAFGTGDAFDMMAEGVTVLPLVPPAAAALAEGPWPEHRLRQLITAGSPLRASVRERLTQRAGLSPVDLYGATELGTIWLDRGHGGEVMEGVEVRIVEPSERGRLIDVPAGKQGEIAIRSATRYERLVGETIDDDHVEGWFRTADLGARDERGTFRVTGWLKLVFDVGGLKVNPYDVEAAIESHPSVRVALVEPILLGGGLARVGAKVELREPGAIDAAALRAFVAELVPAHAVPRGIEFVEALPRTPSGKILRDARPAEPRSAAIGVSRPPVESRPAGLEDPAKRHAWTQALFNKTAPGYDMSSGAAFLGTGRWYRRRMLVHSGLREGMSLLDVGSGTGLCAWLAQSIVGDRGRVVSLDPSPGMLAVARSRGVRETVVGQAERLPFPDASFDMVSMSYMLRHIEDLATAFREARRVLRPCGRIVILEVTRPERGLARRAFSAAMRHLVPAVGVVASGRPSTFPMIRYWADTIEVAARPSAVVGALEEAGFVGVRHLCELGVFSHYRGSAPN